jgi:electron transfer flavoprotein alpha subunit
MATYQGTLVCGEVIDGKITAVTRELLNIARRLCDNCSQLLSTLLIGKNIQEAATEVITLGTNKVYTVNGLPFAESHPDLYVATMTEVCKQTLPSIIIFGHTEMGREVAPRLASRLRTTVTMDCTGLSIDPETKRLLQSKPVYGGNAVATWLSDSHDPQIVTLRPRAVMPAEPDASRKGEITVLDITISDSMIKGRLLETVKEEVKGIKLDDAKVIIAGGGGIGSSDGFTMLEELAKVLGGTIGVTRVPCDEGWKPLALEIGQTGHIVTPNLYFAIGISGAPQHMAGCSGSKRIVAINRDPDAHIFQEADFGVIGDYRTVLPALIEGCKTLLE